MCEPTTSRTPRLHNTQGVPHPTRSAIGRRALTWCSAWYSATVLCHGAYPDAQKKHSFWKLAKYISGGTRTHNLRIRSPTRYPLRHGDIWDLIFADNFSKCSNYVHMNDEILLTFKGTIEILHICSCYTNTNHSHFVWLMEWLINLNKFWNSIYDT